MEAAAPGGLSSHGADVGGAGSSVIPWEDKGKQVCRVSAEIQRGEYQRGRKGRMRNGASDPRHFTDAGVDFEERASSRGMFEDHEVARGDDFTSERVLPKHITTHDAKVEGVKLIFFSSKS